MAYNPPVTDQDPWGDQLLETLLYLKTTAEGAATTAGTKKADSMSTGKLLGRGTGGTGAIEEITLGTNLSLTGTTLNATGGGGGGGDMLAATYDPGNKAANAFNQDNMIDGTTNKNYSATDKTKLAGIASGATANSADATLLARANHTGTQLASTISDFSTAADARITSATGVSIEAHDADLTTIAGLSPTNDDIIQRKSGAWANRTVAQYKTDLALNNVDNTSDATKNAASVTLTNKTISGASNTLSNVSADSVVDGTTNKAYTATEKTKLSGIATAATANSSDATLLARANHTGTQAVSTIASLLTQGSTASSSTPAPSGDALFNDYHVTAAAANMTVSAPSGTPVNANRLTIRFKDNGTARTIAWNAIFRAVGVNLPATTVISKTMYVGARYNSTDSKWDVTSVSVEA